MRKKFVIYTVVTGGYEKIIQPMVLDDRFDYVLFTDSVRSNNIGVWNVRLIPKDLRFDKIRLSRYPKSHPVNLLSEYEASLYIDANIQIIDSWVYSRFIELVNDKVEYAGVKLIITGRDCIYDHAFDMCVLGVEHDYVGLKQCHELFLRNFPSHFGLNENGFIFRMHTDSIKNADNEWWHWITNYSHRDQLSYMYCLWKYNISIDYFLPEGEDVRNSRHLNFIDHNSTSVFRKKKLKKGIFERIRLLALEVDKSYGIEIWTRCYKSNYTLLLYYYYSIIAIIKNSVVLFKLLKSRVK